MVNDSTTANGLIQEQVSTMLVEPLEAQSVVLAAGPTVFNSSEPLKITTLESGFTPEWVGENQKIPDGGQAGFGEIRLMPENRRSIKTIVRVSDELIRMSKVGVSQVLQRRLVTDVANMLDTALLMGDGAGSEAEGYAVTGLINQPDITKADLVVDDPDAYLDALALAAANEVTPNRFILNGQDFFQLRKIKDADGRYIMQNDVAGEAAYRLFGVPVTVTNKLPAGKAILADTKDIAVVRDIDPQVKLLDQAYADYGQIGIRVVTRYDLGLIRPEGVILMETAPVV